MRFAVASALMLAQHYGLCRDGSLPRGRQWGQLAIVVAPSLARSTATLSGLMPVIVAMVSQAVGAVYLKRAALELLSGMINAWQLVLGLGFRCPSPLRWMVGPACVPPHR